MRADVKFLFFFLWAAAGVSICLADETPEARIQVNAQKAQTNPSLRGRWYPPALLPASHFYVEDNLAMHVLSELEKDPDLTGRVLRLKVSSKNGKVLLQGVVNDRGERSLVQDKVKKIEGVKSVESELRVKKSDKEFLDE